jgi:hypothetical protein
VTQRPIPEETNPQPVTNLRKCAKINEVTAKKHKAIKEKRGVKVKVHGFTKSSPY